jgi:N-acetylneuraminic acid mutarotase
MLAPRDAHTATLLQTGLVLVAGGHALRLSSVELYDPASGTWTSAAALPEAFAGHGATLLPNGEVLVSGGDVPSGPGAIGSAHAAIYDPGNDAWTMVANMITPRIGHQATILADGDVLVTGGASVGSPDPDPYDSAELYDTATGAWIAVARMISPRTDHAAVLLSDGRVLVIGGSTRNGVPLASAELFTP